MRSMRSVYENIDIIRDSRRITKRELAKMMGEKEFKVNRWLIGANTIPADVIPAFAVALQVEPRIFFDDRLTNLVRDGQS